MYKFISFAVLAGLLTLTGCNTIRGIGQDIEKAGAAIEKSAK
jgi:predicted small secreted protein